MPAHAPHSTVPCVDIGSMNHEGEVSGQALPMLQQLSLSSRLTQPIVEATRIVSLRAIRTTREQELQKVAQKIYHMIISGMGMDSEPNRVVTSQKDITVATTNHKPSPRPRFRLQGFTLSQLGGFQGSRL